MVRFLIRRVALLVVTMLITSVIIFGLTQLVPGDVARLILGRDASPEALQALREEFGLNEVNVGAYGGPVDEVDGTPVCQNEEVVAGDLVSSQLGTG